MQLAVSGPKSAAMTSAGMALKPQNVALPALILTLIALLVVPIPPLLLDIFFIVNIVTSLLVLTLALGAGKPLDFSSFPTVLLFATLLRLALNVASTRVVLVSGHEGAHAAGEVIAAFGSFIIAGNYIVGLFVFTILVIINLVVIAKGAGRVSEVSARFTLDALPGKQMAIDADLAAGLLTPDEAKARRQDVATEADFYGAMDGASKFVKGDAVAGLLVLFINILGGLLLGTMQHGLTAGEAATTYITLAIGDGLVAQIPSLLLSIAAAAIVTRVKSSDDLAGQVSTQFGVAKAWIPVAAILLIIAVIPGMPHILILTFAGLTGYVAYRLSKPKSEPVEVATPRDTEAPSEPASVDWDDVIDTDQLTLEIGFGLIDLVNEAKGSPLTGRITGVRKQTSQRLGFLVPRCRISDNMELQAGDYRIAFGSETLARGTVRPNALLALDTGDVAAPCPGEDTLDPAFGLPAKWIEPAVKDQAVAFGYAVVDISTVIATHMGRVLSARAYQLFGQEEASRLVDGLTEAAPKVAENLVPASVSLQTLTTILQALLRENVPVRDFRRIAEAICAASLRTQEPGALGEAVRRSLGPVIVEGVTGSGDTLNVVTFGGEIERLLADSVAGDPEAGHRAIEPNMAQRIIESVTQTAQALAARDLSFALVTSPRLRRIVFNLLRPQIPDITVLSFDEIPEEKPVDVVSVIEPAAQIGEAA
ncbi:flagellar biosynthesis protein FlhA [Pacificimonas flava]|uniref:Flagellar biosynthesis protein FlhA n=1 Tax=Pacificimonas flava TaxID=1234595 RepID=M2U863_9SPHN|nr:flagellar biosynthesis protein FlhA [Pacificimonas flava]EMD84173.1 Flagellar biosynthesis protein FlhA [Pacificimonas flava]MBB5279949.1 flagellar biosynthesis protein FlhA [Pacificimonas flava]